MILVCLAITGCGYRAYPSALSEGKPSQSAMPSGGIVSTVGSLKYRAAGRIGAARGRSVPKSFEPFPTRTGPCVRGNALVSMSCVKRFTVAMLIAATVCSALSADTTASVGLSTGAFFAPNPGDAYLVPVTTGVDLRLSLGETVALLVGGLFAAYPFVSLDEAFGPSLMVTGEGYVGARFTVPILRGSRLLVGLLAGGGGYSRTIAGADGAQTSRRPFYAAQAYVGVGHGPWDYELGTRYRLLLESELIHTLEPVILISRGFPLHRSAE